MKKTLLLSLLSSAALWNLQARAQSGHDHDHSHVERWASGHGDLGLGYEDGELFMHLHVDAGSVVNGVVLTEGGELEAEDARILIGDSARVIASEEMAEGAGVAAGETLWVMPQTQIVTLPWLGLNTESLEPADWTGNLKYHLQEVISPSGQGHFSMYVSDGLGGFDFHMSTSQGGVTGEDEVEIAAGNHAHYSMGFSEPGTWRITLTASGEHSQDGLVSTTPVTYVFEVGDQPARWTAGHGDIGLAYEEGELNLHLHLHEGAVVDGTMLDEDLEPDPATTLIVVSDAAIVTSTVELAEGNGVHEGENAWVLPAANRAGLPFLGLGAEELDPEEWASDIRLTLAGVASPSGEGHFAVYQADGLGGYDFAMSTALGGITEDDHVDLPVGEHDHYAFSFSETGVWRITMVASGTHATAGELISEPVTFMFVVGGSTPGEISLSQEFYTATQGDDAVTVTVVRSDASQHAEVTLTASDGPEVKTNPPFASALAGRDYSALQGEDTHVHFEVGEFSKLVTLTLLPPARPVAENRHFVVTLSDPEDGATLGEQTTAVVRILANDTRNPTLTLSSPGKKTSAAIPLAVTGKAGDASGIDRVEVILNNGEPVLAVLGNDAKPNAMPFTAMVIPQVGTNTLIVTAYDMSGNMKQITRRFEFSTRYHLSIQRLVPEAVAQAGDQAGSIKVTAKPGSAASALMPKDPHAAVKSSDVLAGAPVVLTATAKKGYAFSHWENLPDGAVNGGASASFDMPEADVSVTAVFIENPFAPIAGAGNGFQGLILPAGETTPSNTTTGYLSGTLNPASGAFSGQVMVNGLVQRFVAVFTGDGNAWFKSGRSMLPALVFDDYELTLKYQPDSDGDGIAVILSHEDGSSSGSALRGSYSRTARVPEALLNSPSKGYYTMALPAKRQDPVLAANLYPQGTGIASLALDSMGGLRYAGVLADGSKITGSSLLTAGDVAPLFVQLNTPGQPAKVKGGSFGGELAFDKTEQDSDLSGENLFWFRPAVIEVDKPATAAAATRLYTDGWPQGLALDAVGALYDASRPVQDTLGLSAEAPEGNAELVLDQGKLTEEAVYVLNIVGKAVKKLDKFDKSFQLKLAAPKGGFSGSFTPDWTSPAKKAPVFQGIILQKGANRGGYGFFISNAEGDADPESGRAFLGAKSVSE